MTEAKEAGKMAKFVAFLRGINVGGHRKIPMADLRGLLTSITLDSNVQTYIASGNAVFTAKGPAKSLSRAIAQGIKERFGFDVPVLVLTENEIKAALETYPFAPGAGKAALAYFCYDDPQIDQAGITALAAPTEEIAVVGRTVWLFAPDGIGRSKLAAKLERLIGVETTARNLNTVTKLVEMVGETRL